QRLHRGDARRAAPDDNDVVQPGYPSQTSRTISVPGNQRSRKSAFPKSQRSRKVSVPEKSARDVHEDDLGWGASVGEGEFFRMRHWSSRAALSVGASVDGVGG